MTLPYDFYTLASYLAAGFFFIPIVLIACRNLFRNKLLLWFSVYWLWSGLINILCSLEVLNDTFALNIIERLYNLVDIPLLLFIMYKTTQIESIKKNLQKVLLPLTVLEIGVLAVTRFSTGMETALVFCGVVIVLFYIIWTIIKYSNNASFKNSSISYQYIYYALLFGYATSIITVIYSYMLPQKANNDDNFLVFHISTIIAIATASAGILTYHEEKAIPKTKKSNFSAGPEIRYL